MKFSEKIKNAFKAKKQIHQVDVSIVLDGKAVTVIETIMEGTSRKDAEQNAIADFSKRVFINANSKGAISKNDLIKFQKKNAK